MTSHKSTNNTDVHVEKIERNPNYMPLSLRSGGLKVTRRKVCVALRKAPGVSATEERRRFVRHRHDHNGGTVICLIPLRDESSEEDPHSHRRVWKEGNCVCVCVCVEWTFLTGT